MLPKPSTKCFRNMHKLMYYHFVLVLFLHFLKPFQKLNCVMCLCIHSSLHELSYSMTPRNCSFSAASSASKAFNTRNVYVLHFEKSNYNFHPLLQILSI